MLFLCLFIQTNLIAQENSITQVLYPKNQAPIAGMLISMDEKNIVFQDSAGVQETFQRIDIDSVGILKKVELLVEKNSLVAIRAANPAVEIAANLSIDDLSQEHSVWTNWNQKYAGIVTEISTKKLILTTRNGMDLPFRMTEIQKIEVIKTDLQPKSVTERRQKNVQKSYKTIASSTSQSKSAREQRRKELMYRMQRRRTYIPYRIGITPTAFNLPKGQHLFRSSAGYLRELVFSGKYVRGAIGFSGWYPRVQFHVGVPIKKYLHVGLALEATANGNSTEAPNYAFAPILTIGTPDYFINLVYKSTSMLFLPVNDDFDNPMVRPGEYWSFGAGLRIAKNLNFLTESALIQEEQQDIFRDQVIPQTHFRVFAGLSFNIDIQTIGAGLTIYDSQQLENRFSSRSSFGEIVPSFQYTIRFR